MTTCAPCHPPAVRLNKVDVHRGKRLVLRELDTAFPAGRITAIVGRSGGGKSTLIATLNGLIRPSAGTVSVAGLGSLGDPATLHAHRSRTATIFQEHALIDRLSALDNVSLGLAEQRHPLSLRSWPSDLRRRALVALDEVGLLERAMARVGQLSGGERQRVGIARALVRRPVLLLGDEPFSAIDPALVRRFGDEIRSLVARHGLSVVLVLHQIDTARRLADRILGLRDGRIAFDGPAESFDIDAEKRIFDFSDDLPPSEQG